MKKLIVTLTVFSGLQLFIGCQKELDKIKSNDEIKCGDKTKLTQIEEDFVVVSSSYDYGDSTRTIVYEGPSYPCDICTHEQPNLNWEVQTKTSSFDIKWTARANWGAGQYEQVMGHTVGSTTFRSANYSLETGKLEAAFPNQAAWVHVQLVATFKTFGSDSLDRVKLKAEMFVGKMETSYSKYKG